MSYLDWDTTTNRLQRRRRYTLLDGIDSQASSSKPTVRSDGTTLATGDRWLDTTDRLWYFWNGTYWLSEEIYTASFPSVGLTASGGIAILPVSTTYNLFVLRFEVALVTGATNNSTNYWTFALERRSTSADTTEVSVNTSASASGRLFLSTSINVHRDTSALSLFQYRVTYTTTGTPSGTGNLVATMFYRLAKP